MAHALNYYSVSSIWPKLLTTLKRKEKKKALSLHCFHSPVHSSHACTAKYSSIHTQVPHYKLRLLWKKKTFCCSCSNATPTVANFQVNRWTNKNLHHWVKKKTCIWTEASVWKEDLRCGINLIKNIAYDCWVPMRSTMASIASARRLSEPAHIQSCLWLQSTEASFKTFKDTFHNKAKCM